MQNAWADIEGGNEFEVAIGEMQIPVPTGMGCDFWDHIAGASRGFGMGGKLAARLCKVSSCLPQERAGFSCAAR
jgi:hypothetical protein